MAQQRKVTAWPDNLNWTSGVYMAEKRTDCQNLSSKPLMIVVAHDLPMSKWVDKK